MNKTRRLYFILLLTLTLLTGCQYTSKDQGEAEITGPARSEAESANGPAAGEAESANGPAAGEAESANRPPMCGTEPTGPSRGELEPTGPAGDGTEPTGPYRGEETESGLPKEAIGEMASIMAGDLPEEGLTVERRRLMDQSSEGGEILCYRNECDEVVRYRLVYYWEMGRAEDNYYFRNDCIYYTGLVENYSTPIYALKLEINDRQLKQGALYNGTYYQYDSHNNTFSHGNTAEIPYVSLEQLQKVFIQAAGDYAADYDVGNLTDDTRFSEYQILVINGFLLGGYYNHSWIEYEALYPMMGDKDQYKIYIDGQYRSTAAGYKAWSGAEDDIRISCGPMVEVWDISYEDSRDYDIIAFSGSHDLVIESGKEISLDNEIYQKLLKDYLNESGLTEAYELAKVLKIDMDDDEQDEIFIQAYNFVDPIEKSAGIEFMRKIEDDGIKVYPVPVISPTDAADYITIIGFCDLNGDGLKEVLMSSSGIGYSGYLVYEFKDSRFLRIYENGTER